MIPFNKKLYDTGNYDVVTKNNLPVKNLKFLQFNRIYSIQGILVLSNDYKPQHVWTERGNFVFNQSHIYDLFLVEKQLPFHHDIYKVCITFNKKCYNRDKQRFYIHYNKQIIVLPNPELIAYYADLKMEEIIQIFNQDEIDQIKISR